MAFVPYILTKAAGIVGIGYALKDAHYYGKIQADYYKTEKDSQYLAKYLNNTMYLDEPSYMQNKVKNKSFEHELESSYLHAINYPIGYVNGFMKMLMVNIVPFACGLGAFLLKTPLFSKTKHKFTGFLSGMCAIISAGWIAKKSIQSYFALGVPNYLKKDI